MKTLKTLFALLFGIVILILPFSMTMAFTSVYPIKIIFANPEMAIDYPIVKIRQECKYKYYELKGFKCHEHAKYSGKDIYKALQIGSGGDKTKTVKVQTSGCKYISKSEHTYTKTKYAFVSSMHIWLCTTNEACTACGSGQININSENNQPAFNSSVPITVQLNTDGTCTLMNSIPITNTSNAQNEPGRLCKGL